MQLEKLPKRKVTVDDLLQLDSVASTIDYLRDTMPKMHNIIAIWIDKDDNAVHCAHSDDTYASFITMMEQTKHYLLHLLEGDD